MTHAWSVCMCHAWKPFRDEWDVFFSHIWGMLPYYVVLIGLSQASETRHLPGNYIRAQEVFPFTVGVSAPQPSFCQITKYQWSVIYLVVLSSGFFDWPGSPYSHAVQHWRNLDQVSIASEELDTGRSERIWKKLVVPAVCIQNALTRQLSVKR